MLCKTENFLVPTKGKLFERDIIIAELTAFILKANSLISETIIVPAQYAIYFLYVFTFNLYLDW